MNLKLILLLKKGMSVGWGGDCGSVNALDPSGAMNNNKQKFPVETRNIRAVVTRLLVLETFHVNSVIINYRIIIVNTVQCDSICRYLLPLHVSVS
jgi:hypothetical protein